MHEELLHLGRFDLGFDLRRCLGLLGSGGSRFGFLVLALPCLLRADAAARHDAVDVRTAAHRLASGAAERAHVEAGIGAVDCAYLLRRGLELLRWRLGRRRHHLDHRRHGAARGMIERIGAQTEARGQRHDVEGRAESRWRRRLAVGQPELVVSAFRVEAMDRDSALGPGVDLQPQHAAHADAVAGRGEGLLVAYIEVVAVVDISVEVDDACERIQRCKRRRGRYAGHGQGVRERAGDDSAVADLAREGQQGFLLRAFIGAAQQPFLGGNRIDPIGHGSMADRRDHTR